MKLVAFLPFVLAAAGCAAESGASEPGATDGTTTTAPAAKSTDDITCTTFASRGLTEHVARVHLPSGAFEIGAEVPADVVADASSIGVQGDSILTCASTVVRIGSADGNVETSDVACDFVTADAAAVWVVSAGVLSRYASFDGVKAHSAIATTTAPKANRIAPAPDGLLGAMYETDTLVHVSTDTGATTSSLRMRDYEGVILGLSMAGADRVVVAPWYTEGSLFVFDAATGVRSVKLARPATGEIFHGLACE